LDELRTALELATDDELQQLTRILFCRKFNPLDYMNTPDPLEIQSQERVEWIESIEQRFRYLAADGLTVLQGRTQQVTYRQALIQVCRYLKIPYSKQLSTEDLESELFIHLMGKAYQQMPAAEQTAITTRIQKSLTQTKLNQPLPLHVQHDPMKLLLTGSGALVLSSVVQPIVLQQIARQFALHLATYQVTQQVLVKGGMAVAGQIQGYVTLQLAKRGMITTAARSSPRRFCLFRPSAVGVVSGRFGLASNFHQLWPDYSHHYGLGSNSADSGYLFGCRNLLGDGLRPNGSIFSRNPDRQFRRYYPPGHAHFGGSGGDCGRGYPAYW
jgi:uncharacterized protein YaaW (UPF0174 family)